MHLDKSEIDQTIEKISNIMKNGSKFLFSVSVQRDDINQDGKDEKGRHFTTMTEFEWVECCEKYGLQLEYSKITGDGLEGLKLANKGVSNKKLIVYQRIKGLDHYKLILKPNENGDLIVTMYSVG